MLLCLGQDAVLHVLAPFTLEQKTHYYDDSLIVTFKASLENQDMVYAPPFLGLKW